MSKLLYPFLINEKFLFQRCKKANFRKSIVFEILKPRKFFYDYVSKLLFRFLPYSLLFRFVRRPMKKQTIPQQKESIFSIEKYLTKSLSYLLQSPERKKRLQPHPPPPQSYAFYFIYLFFSLLLQQIKIRRYSWQFLNHIYPIKFFFSFYDSKILFAEFQISHTTYIMLTL